MILSSRRFGEIQIDDNKIFQFPRGIPGLEEYKRYALLHHDETYPICWLQSVDDGNISLPVVDPFLLMPEYAFDISDEDIEDLSVQSPAELHVVSVLTIPEKIQEMTVNLAAPILINIRLNLAKQVIIDSKNFRLRQPIFEQVCKKSKEVAAHAGAVSEGK